MSASVESRVLNQASMSDGLTMPLLDVVMAVYLFCLMAFNSLPTGVVVPNALFVLASLIAIYEVFRGNLSLRWNAVTIGAGLVLVGGLLPILAGRETDHPMSMDLVTRFALIYLMILLLASYLNDRKRVVRVVLATMGGYLLAFLVGHVILGNNLIGRAIALYKNPNSAAFFSMYVFFFGVILFTMHRGREQRLPRWAQGLAWVAVAASFWLIWATNSRKVLIAVSLPLLVLALHRVWTSRFRVLGLVGLVVGGMTLGALLLKTLPEEQLKRLRDPIEALASGQGPDRSTFKRLVLYDASIQLIKERPILGYGGGAFQVLGREKFYAFDARADSHSIYMDLYLESGLLGIASYLGIYLAAAIHALGMARPWRDRLLALSWLASMLIIQSGGSLQLDKILWLALIIVYAHITLPVGPPSSAETPA